MVAIAVRTFGQKPVTCNARPLLFQSHASLESGDVIAAGCKLREAVRLYLLAECTYWECLPAKPQQQRSPGVLLKAMRKAKPEFGWDWLGEIIDYSNKLAHCGFVRRSLIEACLSFAHSYLDAATYLVEPTAAGRLS